MAFEWKEEYLVGVTLIDEQHKLLVKLINELDAIRNTKNPIIKSRFKVLESLDYYIKVHFITEEEIMRIYGYPDFERHKQLHLKFSDKISTFRSQYQDEELIFLDSVYTFLESWLINHIAIEDHKLGPFLNSKGLS